jgi:nucleotide-binding universal stress UspA family protein
MKTFVIPTDFSETAKNAALYAAEMAAGKPGIELVLYHAYTEIYAGSDSSPLNDDSGTRIKLFNAALESIRSEMLAFGNLSISCLAEANNSFREAIERYVVQNRIDLVIMGITGTTKLEQAVVGSNTLHVVKRSVCPVMIVPPLAKYKGLKNVVFATDLKDIENNTPIRYIQAVLDIFNPKVHIVHVSSDPSKMSKEETAEKSKLQQLFNNYNPEFYAIKDNNVVDTLDQFAMDNNIDVILTVPRQHALSGIFQTSHTKRLAYHSHVPVIAVHE